MIPFKSAQLDASIFQIIAMASSEPMESCDEMMNAHCHESMLDLVFGLHKIYDEEGSGLIRNGFLCL